MFILIWIQTGFAMVILSAAIKAVPEELLEAARIDGASESEQFFNVRCPDPADRWCGAHHDPGGGGEGVRHRAVSTGGNFGTNVLATDFFDEAFSFLNRGSGPPSP